MTGQKEELSQPGCGLVGLPIAENSFHAGCSGKYRAARRDSGFRNLRLGESTVNSPRQKPLTNRFGSQWAASPQT